MTGIGSIEHDCSFLPPELWNLVVRHLAAADQRRCLSVSRLFYELVHPLVFAQVTIHLGIWNVATDEGHGEAHTQLLQRRKIRNTELFQRIAEDTRFAQIIKGITVRTHKGGFAQLDIGLLVGALKSLPHLRSFRWYGGTPPVTFSILDALAGTCGSTLVELVITITVDPSHAALFHKFKSLQALSLEGIIRSFSQNTEAEVRKWIENTPDTLLRLSVSRYAVWDTPLRIFSRLHELSLIYPRSISRLGVVLENCSQLRTLDICASSFDCGAQFNAMLSDAAPASLPHLTSFKLICCNEAFILNPDPLIAFVRNRKGMRRLDLALNADFTGVDDYIHFLDVLADLPHLEVIGLQLWAESTFTQEHMRLLDERLPLRLSALFLTLEFLGSDVPTHDWISMLKTFPSLAYLHILTSRMMPELRNLHDLLLKSLPPALELLGYDARLNWVERDCTTGQAVYSALWDDATVALQTVDDFVCEDWEWLLRGHIIGGGGMRYQ